MKNSGELLGDKPCGFCEGGMHEECDTKDCTCAKCHPGKKMEPFVIKKRSPVGKEKYLAQELVRLSTELYRSNDCWKKLDQWADEIRENEDTVIRVDVLKKKMQELKKGMD